MAPNLQQTYMTPAASKNKIYFLWDFVGRTLGMLQAVPPTGNPAHGSQKQIWSDVVSKSGMARVLLDENDQTMLEQMVEMTYHDQRGRHPALGADVVEAGKALPWEGS